MRFYMAMTLMHRNLLRVYGKSTKAMLRIVSVGSQKSSGPLIWKGIWNR